MKSPFLLIIVCFLSGTTLFAEKISDLKAGTMLLAYYSPDRAARLLPEMYERAPQVLVKSEMPALNWHATVTDRTFNYASLNRSYEVSAEPLSSVKTVSIVRRTASRPAAAYAPKFSMSNLMEGALYDFQKPNNLRLEVGPPTVSAASSSGGKYEEPFCITFLFRFKF